VAGSAFFTAELCHPGDRQNDGDGKAAAKPLKGTKKD